MKLKSNKGFTQTDIIIAIMIVIIFTSIIATLFVNLGIEHNKLERKTTATYISIQVIESLKKLDYDKVNKDSIDKNSDGKITIDEINALLPTKEKISVDSEYTVSVEIKNYKDYEENKGKQIEDILKKVTTKVTYTVYKEEQEVVLETLISK